MSRLDLGDRVLYPQGGFTRLIEVDRLAGRDARRPAPHGCRGHRDHDATGARRGRARVSGVRHVDRHGTATTLDADVVVGAADLHHLETALLPEHLQTHPERAWRRRSPGPGAVLAMLGVDGELPQLAHHSLFFTADWRQNFGDIFGRDAKVPDPASIYVCKPSATDSSVAPPGSENLFVLVPVPADTAIGAGGDDGGGATAVERTADAAIDLVADWADVPDLRERIRVRHTVGPQDFAERYHSWRGGALGLEHTLRQSAFLRPGNASAKVDGLLYAGSTTIPGVGLPMCLISAELVLKRLSGDRSTAAGGRMSRAAVVLRRDAGVLPGRHAPARARLPAATCCASRVRLLLTVVLAGDAVPAVGPLRHRRRSLALRRRPDAAVAGRRDPAGGGRVLRRHPASSRC